MNGLITLIFGMTAISQTTGITAARVTNVKAFKFIALVRALEQGSEKVCGVARG